VYALDENGKRYIEKSKQEAAVHHVCIRIVDDKAEQ